MSPDQMEQYRQELMAGNRKPEGEPPVRVQRIVSSQFVTRSYPMVCQSCHGSGYINNPEPVSTVLHVTCPACNGNKTVVVTETVYGC